MEAFVSGSALEDLLDEPVKGRVEGAEVGGRDGDEKNGDGRSLDQGFPVGPLDFLQLGPAGKQETDDAATGAALPFGRSFFLLPCQLLALATFLLVAFRALQLFGGFRLGAPLRP